MDKHYWEGYDDAHNGYEIDDCPYCSDSEAYEQWIEGWRDGGGEE